MKTLLTQRINDICEDCVLILRNVTIYGNEVFLLKNTSYLEGNLEGNYRSKQKSEALFTNISKLTKMKKDVLKAYIEALVTLLMRRCVGALLEDYYEALEKPEEKYKRAVKKYITLVNGDCEEEGFLWNGENREDLKEVLKKQISEINEGVER